MTTFKDLLSKDSQLKLKEMSGRSPSRSQVGEANKPTQTTLMGKKEIANQVKRLGSELVDDDKVLFMQAMNGVVPLKHSEPFISSKSTKNHDNAVFRRANAQGTNASDGATLSDMQALLNPVAGEAFLSYKNPTLQNKVFEQLKQGKLRWYDAVDLHGTSIDEARQAVIMLIHQARQNNETVVKIVHGKGIDAIIKTCVNGWLRQMPEVLAFVSAPTNDGGNGAVLVLLKRTKIQEYQ